MRDPTASSNGSNARDGVVGRGGVREASDAALDGVVGAFQPLSPVPLTRDDAREITENLGRFFEILERWAVEDAQKGRGPLGSRLRDLGLQAAPQAPPEAPPAVVPAAAAGASPRNRGGKR